MVRKFSACYFTKKSFYLILNFIMVVNDTLTLEEQDEEDEEDDDIGPTIANILSGKMNYGTTLDGVNLDDALV